MCPGDRAEHQDQYEETKARGDGVFEELESGRVRRQGLRRDPSADDDCGEEKAPEVLGEQPSPQDRLSQQHASATCDCDDDATCTDVQHIESPARSLSASASASTVYTSHGEPSTPS